MLAPSLARLPPPARSASPVPGPARLSPQTLKCSAVRCRSCEFDLVHGFSLQEWSRTPTQTAGGITVVEWALQHVPILPPTSSPPLPPRGVLPVCEQDKTKNQACFHHLHMSPHLQLLVCRKHPRGFVCFDFPLFFLLAGSSGPTARISAQLLSSRLDGRVHKPNLVLEIGSARGLDIGPLTFPMALLILKYSSPHPSGKAGSCRGALLCI